MSSSKDEKGTKRENYSCITSCPPKKLKTDTSKKQQQRILNAAEKLVFVNEDKWDVFAKYLAIQLKEVDQRQASFCENLILETIKCAKVGRLGENSYVILKALSEESVSNSVSHSYETPIISIVPPASQTTLPSISFQELQFLKAPSPYLQSALNPSPNIVIE